MLNEIKEKLSLLQEEKLRLLKLYPLEHETIVKIQNEINELSALMHKSMKRFNRIFSIIQPGAVIIDYVSSPFQDLFVTESSQYNGREGRFRFLYSKSGGPQGCINLDQKDEVVFSYLNVMVDIIGTFHPNSEKIFLIGHGVGTLTRKLHEIGKKITVAEIDSKILEISRIYFDYLGDVVEIGDGQHLLELKENNSFDAILVDAYDGALIPSHLVSIDFFHLVKKKLKKDGLIIINVIGKDKFLNDLFVTLNNVFYNVKIYKDSDASNNLLFIACDRELQEQGESAIFN